MILQGFFLLAFLGPFRRLLLLHRDMLFLAQPIVRPLGLNAGRTGWRCCARPARLSRLRCGVARSDGQAAAATIQGTITAGQVVGGAAAQADHLTVQPATSRAAKKAAVLVGKAAITTGTGVVVTALLGPIVGSLAAGVTGGAVGLGGKAEDSSLPSA